MLFSATTLLRRLKFGHLEPVKLPNRIPFVPTFVGKMYRFLGRERPLAFVTAVSAFSAVWSKKHAVVDQLDRASDSLINGCYAGLDHRRFLDIAEGSAVKVAAYLGLAERGREASRGLQSTEGPVEIITRRDG